MKNYLPELITLSADEFNALEKRGILEQFDTTSTYLMDLSGRDFTDLPIQCSWFEGVNFSNCIFGKISTSKFIDCDFTNATFTHLESVVFTGSNMQDANFYNCVISTLFGDLSGAKGITEIWEDPRGYPLYVVETQEGLRYTAGCRYYTFLEALQHWKSVDYLETERGIEFSKHILHYQTFLEPIANGF